VTSARTRLGGVLRPVLIGAAILAVLAPATAAQADPTPAQIESQIRTESAHLEEIVEQYNLVTEQLAASQATSAQLAVQIQPLAKQLDEAQQLVTKLAVRAYQGGALAEFGAVLASGNPSAVVERMTTLDQVSRIEQTRIETAVAAKASYDTEAAKYSQLIAEQTAQQQSLDAQKQEIDAKLDDLYEKRRLAYGQAQITGAAYTGTPPAVAGAAGVAVSFAYGAIGTPYAWAGEGPNGYDCSGLTKMAWAAAGVSLPHNAAMQWNALPHISRAALAPGDLVFYSGLNHVGIYVGDGQIIHAPSFGDYVRLASVDVMSPYGYARPG
jgi:peptidoglycan DL-endopeptidase CwlO